MKWATTTDKRLAICFAVLMIATAVVRAQTQSQTPAQQAKTPPPAKNYAPYPNPGPGYVTDNAGLLSADQEEQIEQWLWQTESRTNVEIIVVTIKSISDYPGTNNQSIESFARGLFDAYGVGNMPENNGVLLLVAVQDRKARIELGAGYGRSRDSDAARIMDKKIIPYFKKNDYPGGITAGVKAIMLEFASVRVGVNWTAIILLVAIVALGLVAFSLFRSGKHGWGWVCVGLMVVLMFALFRLMRSAAEHMPEGGSGGWSSGGFGGGFGGGFSGGGGATGSW